MIISSSEPRQFDYIIMFAFRYALGRMTTAPDTVCEFIKANIDSVDPITRLAIIKEIEECKDYGMGCDKYTWLGLAEFLKENLNNDEDRS